MLPLSRTPQVQDLVPLPQPSHAEGDNMASPTHSSAGHLLTALDVDGDGAASRRDMLLAFRRDRQLAGGWHHREDATSVLYWFGMIS
jgi:hypothetical protein